MQRTIADVSTDTADLSVYEENVQIFYHALLSYGYHCVRPGGAFYLFPRTPEPDAYAFCERAKAKDLIVVPGDIFGCPGHFRIACCVPTQTVRQALPIFRKLMEEYQ